VSAQKYRKRPVVIEAMQWTGDNLDAIREWAGTDAVHGSPEDLPDHLVVTTIHGERATARIGDWIIPEPQPGRFFLCQDAVFEAIYEPVTPAEEEPGGVSLGWIRDGRWVPA
jgi:hypothetical protein